MNNEFLVKDNYSHLATALKKLSSAWEATDDMSDEQLDKYAAEFRAYVHTHDFRIVDEIDSLLVFIRERDVNLYREIHNKLHPLKILEVTDNG